MNADQDPKQILLTILSIVGHEEGKEQFADQFLELTLKRAFADYYAAMPEDQKQALDTKLAGDDTANLAQLHQLIQDDARFSDAVQKAAESMLTEYVQEITPVLTDEQQKKLQEYLGSLNEE